MSRARDFADLAGAADAGGLTGKNMVTNGAMTISQRGTSFTGHGAGVNYGIDRFFDFHNSDGAFTLSQETSVVPDDFTHALKVLITTADASIAAGQRLIVATRCEGNTVSHLNWGTSAARTVTLSFYVRSSITGTHGGAIGNGSDNRNYPFTYTISSADTWERKTITIPGDTTGTWATGTGRGLQIVWGLGVGSTYSGTAGSWAAGDVNSATGATTDVLGTLNATWYLTGVQLEVGEQATPFDHSESYGETLAKCQRYYFKFLEGSSKEIGVGWYFNNTHLSFMFRYPTTMRATPTATDTTGTNYYIVYRNNTSDAFNSVNFENGSTEQYSAFNNTEISGTAGQAGIVRSNNASAKIEFDAEL